MHLMLRTVTAQGRFKWDYLPASRAETVRSAIEKLCVAHIESDRSSVLY